MGDPRRHHFVPRFYLRGFSRDDRIGVVLLGESKRFVASVDRAAVETDFYLVDTEDGPSLEVESLLAVTRTGDPRHAEAMNRSMIESAYTAVFHHPDEHPFPDLELPAKRPPVSLSGLTLDDIAQMRQGRSEPSLE